MTVVLHSPYRIQLQLCFPGIVILPSTRDQYDLFWKTMYIIISGMMLCSSEVVKLFGKTERINL